uniref:PE-PGRS family protein n=1 Tax=Parastrongyloides trichosuri TaxID=131310 RepID=A0A0N4ZJK6_PARTI
MVGVLEHIGRHQRRQQTRHHQREEDADAGGQRKGLEELADDAGHEAHGREHGDDGAGRGHDRQADLVGGLEGGVIGRLAVAHVADDVLDLHDGVVDQDADRQRQGQQRHHVQRLVHRPQDGEGRDQRHRHGRRRDQGRAPVAQEDPHHDDGQDGAQQQGFQRGEVAFLDILHAGGDLFDGQLGVGFVDLGDLGADLFGDLDLAGLPRAQEVEGDGFLTIVAGQTAGLAPLVHHGAEIAQTDALAIAQRDQGFAQLIDRGGGAQGADGALSPRHGDAAAGQVVVDVGQGLADLGGGDAVGGQALRVQLDADLAVDAAGAIDLAHAAERQQGAAHLIVDEPADLFRRHGRRADDIGDQGVAGDVDALDRRFLHVLGQGAAHAAHGVAHVVGGAFGIGAQLELDGGRGHAVGDVGIDVAHARQAGDRVLDHPRDLDFHLGRGRARTGGGDGDQGEVDVGVVVDPHPRETGDAAERQQDEQQDDRNGILDGPGGDVVHGRALLRGRGGSRRGGSGSRGGGDRHLVALVQEAGALDHDADAGLDAADRGLVVAARQDRHRTEVGRALRVQDEDARLVVAIEDGAGGDHGRRLGPGVDRGAGEHAGLQAAAGGQGDAGQTQAGLGVDLGRDDADGAAGRDALV